MGYDIRRYTPEFEDQVVKLQTHLWSNNLKLNEAYLKWKYYENPYISRPIIFLALYGGKVVGMRGMYGAKWEATSPHQTFPAPCAGDVVISPDHRNKGLFRMMTAAALKDLDRRGYKYAFNLSAGITTHLSCLAMGWKSIGPLMKMERRNIKSRISEYLLKFYKKQKFFDQGEYDNPFHSLDEIGFHRKSNSYTNVRVSQSPDCKEMADLIGRIDYDGRIRHLRDNTYFSWRYRNPFSIYRFLFWQRKHLEGYLVLRASVNRESNVINIVDWEATDVKIVQELLYLAIRSGNFYRLNIFSSSLKDSFVPILKYFGFKVSKHSRRVRHHDPSLLIRSTNDRLSSSEWLMANKNILDFNNWDLRMIYSDSY
jgi:GNAT superfamily N-acetyltransferase